MSLNDYISDIERLESAGAVIVIKWDGERSKNRRTLVIQNPETDYQYRKDTDDLEQAIVEGIHDFHEHHS